MRPNRLLCGIALLLAAAGADARTILITNDDGLTSNIRALHDALTAAGHEVLVSVPCTNQSGMSGAIRMTPPKPLAASCRNGAAAAGAPPVGPITREGFADYAYVDGTPVMALLHGLTLAEGRWGRMPDLVLSGPNEGQNVGTLVLASGTIGAAQMAASRGMPAIAVSAGANSAGGAELANPASAVVALRTVALVADLDRSAGGGRLLPDTVFLNVNFPDDPALGRWQLTRVGHYQAYLLGMADGGLTFGPNSTPPTAAERHDEAARYRTGPTISILQAGFAGDPALRKRVARRLAPFVRR